MSAIYTRYTPQADDGDCVICQDSLGNGNTVVAHEGGGIRHPFHLDCIRTSAVYSRICPCCRTPTDINSLYSREERLDIWKNKIITQLKNIVLDAFRGMAWAGIASSFLFAAIIMGTYLSEHPTTGIYLSENATGDLEIHNRTWAVPPHSLVLVATALTALKIIPPIFSAIQAGLTLRDIALVERIPYIPGIARNVKVETAAITVGIIFLATLITLGGNPEILPASLIGVMVGHILRNI